MNALPPFDLASRVRMVERGGAYGLSPLDGRRPSDHWPPVTITKVQIEKEIERLADLPEPPGGRREILLVHPNAPDPGRGLTPGVQVLLSVLKPGESEAPQRENATQVIFCIRGGGNACIGSRTIAFGKYDVWNIPSYAIYRHVNRTSELQARLTYSNAALLEMMRVHMVEMTPMAESAEGRSTEHCADLAHSSPFGTIEIGSDGARLMPYELLINPPSVNSNPLHWPWSVVKSELDKLAALGRTYVGRRLYLLYNPVTGRFNGTTPNIFATITIRPPGIVDRPHRHVSSAINYYFHGKGYSVVDGKRYEWSAGDLMVSAPGWAVHNHASYENSVYELTIQDQPLNIYMESLLWQEDLRKPASLLGTGTGFSISRPR
jgi:gentisate 1,2-dioxygenase